MFVLAVVVVKELGIMHLVIGSETYKTTLAVVTQAMGRIDEIFVKVGGVQCTMTFMVVDMDNYDVLFGLDFLIKIGAIMDVERGLIQIKHGLGANVEVLPLTMVNLLQRMNSKTLMQDVTIVLEDTHMSGDSDIIVRIPYQYSPIIPKGVDASAPNLDIDIDNIEHCDEGHHQVEKVSDENEFRGTKFENLVLLEQILQLILQEHVDGFMEEEIIDTYDYAKWFKWGSNVEKRKQAMLEFTKCVEIPILLQVHEAESGGLNNNSSRQLTSSNNDEINTRWKEIW